MSMNLFRLCGDMSHVFSIIVLLLRLRVAKNAQGKRDLKFLLCVLLLGQGSQLLFLQVSRFEHTNSSCLSLSLGTWIFLRRFTRFTTRWWKCFTLLRLPPSFTPFDSKSQSSLLTTRRKIRFCIGGLLSLHVPLSHWLLTWLEAEQRILISSSCSGLFQFTWRQFPFFHNWLCCSATERWRILLETTSFSWEPTDSFTSSIGSTEPTQKKDTSIIGLFIFAVYCRHCFTLISFTTTSKGEYYCNACILITNQKFQFRN